MEWLQLSSGNRTKIDLFLFSLLYSNLNEWSYLSILKQEIDKLRFCKIK